jgi:hypothetical protein
MRLFAIRLIAAAALVALYVVSPLVGIAALVAGFSFLVWRRTPAVRTLHHVSGTAGN